MPLAKGPAPKKKLLRPAKKKAPLKKVSKTSTSKSGKDLKLDSSSEGELPQPADERPRRFPLDIGWRKLQLIHELARMEHTQSFLAKKYGVTSAAISYFKKRHAEAIQDVKDNIEDEFAGLWIAKKRNRIAAYMEQFDLIGETLHSYGEAEPKLVRAAQAALRSVAEELGQLPARVNVVVQPDTVGIRIEGVETDKL